MNLGQAPAGHRQAQGRESPQDAVVGIRPDQEHGYQPEEPCERDAARLEVAQECERPPEQHERRQVGPGIEVERAGAQGQGHEEDRQEPVDPGPDQAMGRPGVEPGQQGGRRQEQPVQLTDLVDQGHGAFRQPFLGDPGPARMRVTERVGGHEAARRKDPLPDHDVPERARIAKELAPPEDHQAQPEAEEDPGLRSPESSEEALTISDFPVAVSYPARTRHSQCAGGRIVGPGPAVSGLGELVLDSVAVRPRLS